MPTAAKLVAAMLFGALAWVVSQLTIPYVFEEGQNPERFAEINAALGALVGWRVAGPRGGTGWAAAVSYGITTTVAGIAVVLFAQSVVAMVGKAFDKDYDGPVEAVVGVFQLMAEYGATLAHPDVLGTLALGGILAGLVTEWAGRNFR